MRIIYRMCPEGNPAKQRPRGMNKMSVISLCLESVEKAFPGVHITFLIDKPNLEIVQLADSSPNPHKIETFHFGSWEDGNIGTFHRQLDLAADMEKVLLLEDDYYFVKGAGKKIEKVLGELEFLTPYDHPGYYTEDIHNYKRQVRVVGGHHWQTVDSTTLSFASTGQAIRGVMDTMKEHGWRDHYMWLEITKDHKLWSPMPSLATHMEAPFLAPAVDWWFK